MTAQCPHCSLTWSAKSEAHCRAKTDNQYCCAHFSSTTAADRHWPRGKHSDPSTIDGLVQRDNGTWTTPISEEALKELRG